MITLLVLAAVLMDGDATGPEPIVGLPCEGCEYVFEGMPTHLASSARIAPHGAKGEAMVVEGTVRDANGKPVEGTVIYAYQTDADGLYPPGATAHGALRAWVVTDANGRYRFDTVRPGAYPGRNIAQHIHMHVVEPGKATYYIDDVTFTDDPLLPASERARRTCRGGCGVTTPVRNAEGTWHVRRDIVLGEAIPGYPG